MKIITLIIIFSLGTVFLFFKEKKTQIEQVKPDAIKTVQVRSLKKLDFSKELKLRGFTEASRIVVLRSQVEGRISSKNFEKGILYDAGSQILLIDPEDKVARLKEMEALLNQRKKEYEVAENLYKKGFRSEVKLSESRTNFENALAKYEKSQVELNNTKILIPFKSSVEESFVELGDYVKKGDPLSKIVDLDPIYINVSATENEIIELKLNQKALIKIGENIHKGKINFISRTSDPETRNFKIQVEVSNPNNVIYSGLTAEIIIKLANKKAFFISSSLVTLNNIGEIGIKILKDEKVKFVKAKILSDSGNGYWVNLEDELKSKEILIITQGHEYTLDGEKVKPILAND